MGYTPSIQATFITIRFNGRMTSCPEATTLEQFLNTQSIAAESVATAVNTEFVPRQKRAHTVLKTGDEIMSFGAVVGG